MASRKQPNANFLQMVFKYLEILAKSCLPVIYTLVCLGAYERAKALLPADTALWVFVILFVSGISGVRHEVWRFIAAFLEALKSGK